MLFSTYFLFFCDFSEEEKSSFNAKSPTTNKIFTQTLNYNCILKMFMYVLLLLNVSTVKVLRFDVKIYHNLYICDELNSELFLDLNS